MSKNFWGRGDYRPRWHQPYSDATDIEVTIEDRQQGLQISEDRRSRDSGGSQI